MTDRETMHDGPTLVVTSRLTCEGCKHLHTERWEFECENDEIDSGTSANCHATAPPKSISAYWNPKTQTPKWCPKRIELQ